MTTEKEVVDIIRSQLAEGEVRFTHSPDLWANCAPPVTLNWTPVQFNRDNRGSVPNDAGGIYGFVLKPSFHGPPRSAYLLYIGKTTEFHRRYGQYLFYQSPTGYKERPHIHDMLNKWPSDIWFFYAPVDDLSLIGEVEETVRDSCIPPFNIEFKAKLNTAAILWRQLGSFR